jgi:hypothetical protein
VPQKMKTPPIIIDPDLIKSTSEHNRKNTSPIGEMFGYRTPNVTDVEPIPLPRFTPERKPERWEVDVDRTTPLVKLIQPRTDLLRTPDKISTWFKNNITIFNKPSHYVGHEANTDAPTLYDTSDLRILIVRLSAYDAVAGSMTHGAIAQMVRQSARDHNFSVYIDHAYMPSLNGDMKIMQEQKIPWWFGRTSKRHPRDFDAILVSNALTLEIWNIIPGLIYSGIAPFKTMRGTDTKIGDPVGSPLIIVGGVVSDFVESLYGECCGQRCVPDVTLIGDGEYILPRTMNLLHQCKSQGLTKADFLRRGHDLPEDEDFERDSTTRGKTSWWYEPDLYTHTYDKEPDPTTGYRELRSITRNPGHEYAAAPGLIKRSVVRDLNETPVWEEAPLQYDGQLGDSVDIQISSGCLCVAGETVIETQFGFETIKEAYDRQQEEGEFGILIQTRHGLQGAEKIVHTGKKIVRTYKFRDENNQHPYEISCTPEHKFDTAVFGDSEANWTEAGRLEIGQEIAVVDPEHYESARETGGKLNTQSQHYYTAITRYDLYEISDPYEVDCYDIKNCDVHEYIANGLITHNSGGLCSFCLAEGTLITVKNPDPKATSTIQVPIEKLEDTDYQGDIDERYFDTPYGLQRPDGVGYTGEKECIEIKTSLGHTLTGTLDHEVLIHRQGKVQKIQIGDLVVGDKMILISTITKDKVSRDSGRRDFLYPEMQGSRSHQKRQSLERDAIAKAAKARGENAETAVLDAIDQQKQTDAEQKEWLMKVRKANGYEDTITELNRVGLRKVYDVWNIPKGHVFYANGFVVGNCHEAHTQGRWRERSLDVIKQAAERAVRKQGAQMASFYSLTWSLHSHIYSLLAWSYSRFGNTNLISQRADQASADPDFFKYQNQQGENHATVGVEGMSQRMRNYFNKSLHTDQFTRMCENAAWAGYSSLKLFMIMSGLENGDDVQEYCELLRFLHTRFKEIAQERSRQLGREVNPPKLSPSFMLLLNAGHTSLQWAPCTSSFDLENNSLAPVVQTTRECGFGFRTALTRDRVRHSQWSCMAGRESTEVIADVGLRCNFVNYGPIQPQVTWRLHEALQERGYDWMYFFREKFWNQVLPWDAIQTPMRRDYLWNQWLAIRKFLGIAYCLKTSINLNPKCHDCGACGTGEDKKFMLTRPLETSDTLHGKEAARRDMTVRKRVRFDLEITDTSLRLALKSILARHLVRAMMLAASEPEDQGGLGFENRLVSSFLRVDDHSLKHAEGMNSLPWVGGHVLVDIVFNDNWPDPLLRRLLPRINEILNETFPPDAPGYTLNNFSSGEKLESLNGKVFQLLTIELPIPAYDLRSALEVYDEKESISYKAKVNVAKDVMRTEVVTRIRSEVIPMALIQSPNRHGGHTRLTYLCTLGANPMQVLLSLTSKPPRIIKGNPLISLGIFKPMEPEADDIWAELEERSTACSVTGEPIELDVFTGERYRSISGANLCLAADLKGLLQMREQGIKIGGATITM